jgi:thioredoxin family protein
MTKANVMNYQQLFPEGLLYQDFLDRHGTMSQRERWNGVRQRVKLSDPQQQLLRSFRREMKVFCLAGAWCGDCAEQCPIFDAFAAECPAIALRFFDRDQSPALAQELSVCGAARVPAVLFVSEDDFPTGRYGDRTLAKYRQMTASYAGASCSTGLAVESDLLSVVIQEWLDQFERNQLILRTSSRLRSKHGD